MCLSPPKSITGPAFLDYKRQLEEIVWRYQDPEPLSIYFDYLHALVERLGAALEKALSQLETAQTTDFLEPQNAEPFAVALSEAREAVVALGNYRKAKGGETE